MFLLFSYCKYNTIFSIMQYIVLKFCKKNYRYPPKSKGYLYYNRDFNDLKDFKVVKDFGD